MLPAVSMGGMITIVMPRGVEAVVALIGLMLSGCAAKQGPAFPVIAQAPVAYAPQSGSGNAFDGYALAALEAEKLLPVDLNRVFFTPKMRLDAIEKLRGPLSAVAQASRYPCRFEFTGSAPFVPVPFQSGWRILGRAMVWQIENALTTKKYEFAINTLGVASKFGYDLTGGGATDAALGFGTVNECRRAFLPALLELTAPQLDKLTAVLLEAIKGRPALQATIEHERTNFLLAVQAVQDMYRRDDYAPLQKNLGDDVKEAITFLKELRSKDGDERVRYFQGFVAEADAEAKEVAERASQFAIDRKPFEPFPDDAYRPWKRIAKMFFLSARPLLTMSDRTLAQTRLFILESMILGSIKKTGSAPKDIRALGQELISDPYTGRPFVYKVDRSDYRLYSVGDDLIDNGGDTNETFTRPDVTLETGLN